MNPVSPEPQSAEVQPDVIHLVTEDDTPVDNFPSEAQQRCLVTPLRDSWTDPGDKGCFVASANVGLYFSDEEPPLVPDFLLSLDVKVPADWWAKKNRCYFMWRFGKPPDVVVEIVSNQEGGEDREKMKTYARIGVSYYVIYDPQCLLSEEVLRVYGRVNHTYERVTPEWLPGMNLGLTLWRGIFEGREDTWLRWIDHNGKIIPTGAERAEEEKQRAEQEKQRAEQEKQRAEQEKQRAEQEKQRAEQEKQRAEQEKQRAERFAAQLRARGIEPEA